VTGAPNWAHFNANVSEILLAFPESIRKPKLRAFGEGDLESTLLSAAHHRTAVNLVGIELGVLQKEWSGEERHGDEQAEGLTSLDLAVSCAVTCSRPRTNRMSGIPVVTLKNSATMTFGGTTSLGKRRYSVLLAVLLALLVVQSFVITTASEGIVRDVMATILGVVIFLVVFDRSTLQTVMAVFMVICICIGWGRHFHSSPQYDHALLVIFAAASAGFDWVVVWAILHKLFRTPVIGVDNVFGAICGYIIMGQGWAHLNSFTYLFTPSAYLFDPRAVPSLADWHGRTALFAYYSYSQMLTIGYAVVTPLKAPATTLSLLAALSGLFYTAVIVSQLVAMAQAERKEMEGEK